MQHLLLIKFVVAYGIQSQKKQAKEGLTLRLKLEHFLTIHKHIYHLNLYKKNRNKLNLPRHHEIQDFP